MAREPFTRAEFLKILAAGAGASSSWAAPRTRSPRSPAPTTNSTRRPNGERPPGGDPYMTVVHGTPVDVNVRTAIAKLGG